jgi:hypothetical protein
VVSDEKSCISSSTYDTAGCVFADWGQAVCLFANERNKRRKSISWWWWWWLLQHKKSTKNQFKKFSAANLSPFFFLFLSLSFPAAKKRRRHVQVLEHELAPSSRFNMSNRKFIDLFFLSPHNFLSFSFVFHHAIEIALQEARQTKEAKQI